MLQTKGEKSRKLRNAQVVDPTSVVLYIYEYVLLLLHIATYIYREEEEEEE